MGPRYWTGVLLVLGLLGWGYYLGGSFIYLCAVAALASAILHMLPAEAHAAYGRRTTPDTTLKGAN